MRLTTYNPWSSLQRVHSDLDNLFKSLHNYDSAEDSALMSSEWMPSVNIKDEQDRYVLTADVPGVNDKDLEITMEDGVLTIKGQRTVHTEDEEKHYRRTERVQGKFFRRFSFPRNVDSNKIKATNKDGVLEVVIPKTEKAKSKRIKVST